MFKQTCFNCTVLYISQCGLITDVILFIFLLLYSAAWGTDALVCCGTWCTLIMNNELWIIIIRIIWAIALWIAIASNCYTNNYCTRTNIQGQKCQCMRLYIYTLKAVKSTHTHTETRPCMYVSTHLHPYMDIATYTYCTHTYKCAKLISE